MGQLVVRKVPIGETPAFQGANIPSAPFQHIGRIAEDHVKAAFGKDAGECGFPGEGVVEIGKVAVLDQAIADTDAAREAVQNLAAPGGLDPVAREALGTAIRAVAEDSATEANALLTKGFGGPSIRTGEDLDTYMAEANAAAAALIKAVSE